MLRNVKEPATYIKIVARKKINPVNKIIQVVKVLNPITDDNAIQQNSRTVPDHFSFDLLQKFKLG